VGARLHSTANLKNLLVSQTGFRTDFADIATKYHGVRLTIRQ
jgi:hypothetical protein